MAIDPKQNEDRHQGDTPGRAAKTRNVLFAVLGAALLVAKGHWLNPADTLAWAHGGNLVVSFALYFAVVSATWEYPRNWLLAAALTLLAVQLFEALDGFGLMSNVYDRWDYVANLAGVALAVVVDLPTRRFLR